MLKRLKWLQTFSTVRSKESTCRKPQANLLGKIFLVIIGVFKLNRNGNGKGRRRSYKDSRRREFFQASSGWFI